MLRTLTLELPETTLTEIEEQAQNKGVEPSELAVELLTAALQRTHTLEPDPLDALIGGLDVPFDDIAELHDDYLGSAILKGS